jgi:hypothetical protein
MNWFQKQYFEYLDSKLELSRRIAFKILGWTVLKSLDVGYFDKDNIYTTEHMDSFGVIHKIVALM